MRLTRDESDRNRSNVCLSSVFLSVAKNLSAAVVKKVLSALNISPDYGSLLIALINCPNSFIDL